VAESVGSAGGAPALPSAVRKLDPSAAVFGAAALILIFLVVVPLAWIFVASVHSDADETLTLSNYVRAFSRSIYLEPIRNSLVLATAAAVLAAAIHNEFTSGRSRSGWPNRRW